MWTDDDLSDDEKRDAFDRGRASIVYENGRVTYRVTRTFYHGSSQERRTTRGGILGDLDKHTIRY